MNIKITYVRAATVLIESDTVKILTDPWFKNNLRGLKCLKKPGMSLSQIGKVDYIVASHYHPDHFDCDAIKILYQRNTALQLIGPQGLTKRCNDVATNQLAEVKAWHKKDCNGFSITAVPAKHSGLELNYILQFNQKSFFFGGDARYSHYFTEIYRRGLKVDVAFLPVGGTRVFGRKIVMSPQDAYRAATELDTSYVIPIHEGGIWHSVPPLSLHPGRAEHFVSLAAEKKSLFKVNVLKNGETFWY